MLPLQQAYEVKQSLLEYLKATFSFKDEPYTKRSINSLIIPKKVFLKDRLFCLVITS